MAGARKHADDLRGAGRLAVEATRGITDLVHELHRTIASGPWVLGRPLARPAGAITGFLYGSIQRVTRLVGGGVDRALAQLAPLLGESVPGPEREAVLAALNGVVGDTLAASGNPLAMPMEFRQGGVPLAVDAASLRAAFPGSPGKLLVLVHGSCMNDLQWRRTGHDHGAALARDLGFTPLYLRYNSGLHVSTNGRALAALLETTVAGWPAPVQEIVLLGHSMGGLVLRAACREAELGRLAWRAKVRALVCLGTPHHGSPLERTGSWAGALLGATSYSAPFQRLARLRSAGVTDLRFGNVLDEHWSGRDRFAPGRDERAPLPLPAGVACYAVAASRAKSLGPELPGDGLVPVDSALGLHANPDLSLSFPQDRSFVALDAAHLDLLSRADVYDRLRSWLSSNPPSAPASSTQR